MSAPVAAVRGEEAEGRFAAVRAEGRAIVRGGERCDACGEPMQPMGHCKWLCRCCGFLRTCIDTV
jgi:hypothetical protein